MSTLQKRTPGGSGQALANTNEKEDTLIIGGDLSADKPYRTLQAEFALKGHEFRMVHIRDGRTLYQVGRWGHARVFSHPHDVQAFLVQIGGAA